MQRSRPLLTLGLRLLVLLALIALGMPAAQPLRAQGCTDAAEIVEQSFEPSAAEFAPASEVTVSWTLENVGDCTWSRTYRVIFISGDRMDGARTTRLRAEVAPGETVTLSLELTAPDDPDTYSGTWRLRNSDGTTFGPDLAVELAVGSGSPHAATTDVVLPEVLAFGGLGGAGDAEAINFCLEFGVEPGVPALVVDYEALQYHYTTLYICSLPEGATVTVDITDPEGNVFSRDFVEDEPVTAVDDAGNEYTSTVLSVYLTWIEQAPRGEWLVEVTSEISGEDFYDFAYIEVTPQEEYPYASLDNWPVTPIDPFIAGDTCNYGYLPGETMMIGGRNLLPDTAITIGVYQDRMSFGYLVDQFTVQSDANGEFVIEYAAWPEVGSYTLMILNQEMLPSYTVEDEEYNLTYAGEHASGCAQVILAEEPEIPLRLLFHAGQPESAIIHVLELRVGQGYPLTVTDGQCQTIEADWWPDGEWVIYQSNCIRTPTDDGWYEMSASDNYDLFGMQVDFEFLLPPEETFVQLTATSDLHEMEPDANADALIVYTQMAVGDDLSGSGELHLLDLFEENVEESDVALGLYGRAPTWSPDGSRIAFMSDVDGTWQIYVYDFERESVWLVSRGCETHCRLPAWSPNGREIIYHQATALDDFTPTGLWIAPARGIARPRLFLSGEFGRPSWSEEGWIVFQGPEGIYRASDEVAAGEVPEYHRYLYSDPEVEPYAAPVWSR